MSTTFRYGSTLVYTDGTVDFEDTPGARGIIPGKKLLFSYHFSEPDHGYVAAGCGSLNIDFARGATISQLQKIIDNIDIDTKARAHVRMCIKNNKLESA